jgi:ribose 5-phosphate isomerase A
MPDLEAERRLAARHALRFINDGQVIGLGSGRTAAYAIRGIAELVRGGLKVRGIPTSNQSRDFAASLGIPVITLDDCAEIDVTIDGADEISPDLQLIKGGGGALLHEKVVESATRQLVIIADSNKQVQTLGKFPLPVEVVAFAEPVVRRWIERLGAAATLRQKTDGKPFITDEGHHILDCHFGTIPDPRALARQLSAMPGVMEHGLFIDMANVVVVGKGSEAIEITHHAKQMGSGL